MAKHRSPNCPQITFAEAIEKGRSIYKKEHTHPASRAVVAEDLGYSGISGRSLTFIGALRQYSILEGSGDALRISPNAVAYYEMDDGDERDLAIRKMVFAPDLFAELAQTYSDKLPSDGNLKHALVTKGFSSAAAEDVIRVYRANLELVTGEQSGYSGSEGKQTEVSMNPATVPPAVQRLTPGLQTYAFALSPNARAELNLRGEITPEDLELLRDHIELTIKALARNANKESQR
jgi:hypothetical protein